MSTRNRLPHLFAAVMLTTVTFAGAPGHPAKASSEKVAQYCVPQSDDGPTTTRLYCSR